MTCLRTDNSLNPRSHPPFPVASSCTDSHIYSHASLTDVRQTNERRNINHRQHPCTLSAPTPPPCKDVALQPPASSSPPNSRVPHAAKLLSQHYQVQVTMDSFESHSSFSTRTPATHFCKCTSTLHPLHVPSTNAWKLRCPITAQLREFRVRQFALTWAYRDLCRGRKVAHRHHLTYTTCLPEPSGCFRLGGTLCRQNLESCPDRQPPGHSPIVTQHLQVVIQPVHSL